ncbi:MAG: DUF547 domain-containing protein [Tagaea sp.]|nr:DUF547 domain-containing protein [Tagaea sp.]
MRKILIALSCALSLGACATVERALAPSAELDPRFVATGDAPGPDHAAWGALLARHRKIGADGIARFAYAEVTRTDRAALGAYIDALARVDPRTLTRPAQFAYWVNLYNALTVRVVLDHAPVASILDIRPTPGALLPGPFRAKMIAVAGADLSLDDIEHRILRPIWRDPRIHYVVNCASLGCPDLPATPLDPRDLDSALDAAARAYIGHPRGLAIEGDGLVLSKIYLWFREDFGGDEAGLRAHLAAHASPAVAARIEAARRIADYRYDWSLNDAR